MFNGPSPLAYPTYGKNINTNTYSWMNNQNLNMNNPQEVELMMRQKFNQNSLSQNNNFVQSDPYQEFQALMSSCSPNIKYKIMNNEEYIQCDNECEMLIKQAMEEAIIPQILLNPQGRLVFEKFLGVAKKLKDKYSKEEMDTAEQFQKLMQDEIVQKRLRELSGNATNNLNNIENNKMEEFLNDNR